MAKKPAVISSSTLFATRHTAPPAVSGTLQRGQRLSDSMVDLNFKVSVDFRRRFKMRCAQEGLKSKQLLERAFEAYEEKHR